MNSNNAYKIKNISVSTNGRNEIYLDIEWKGDDKLDYLELRAFEDGKDHCLEALGYPSHQQRVILKPHSLYKNWRTKEVNKHTIYVELGIAEYDDNGEQLSWKILADYEPVELNIYYEFHLFHKNVIELR
jgi:hypothetical protein